jgi:hypothetical protein
MATNAHGIPLLKALEVGKRFGGVISGGDDPVIRPVTIPARRKINDEYGYCGPAVKERA